VRIIAQEVLTNEEAVLEVIPHTALSDHQIKVVARDFGMTSDGGQPLWRVKIRNCLVGYFPTYYGLDLPNAHPPRHVLTLRNRDELKPLCSPPQITSSSLARLARSGGGIDWK